MTLLTRLTILFGVQKGGNILSQVVDAEIKKEMGFLHLPEEHAAPSSRRGSIFGRRRSRSRSRSPSVFKTLEGSLAAGAGGPPGGLQDKSPTRRGSHLELGFEDAVSDVVDFVHEVTSKRGRARGRDY